MALGNLALQAIKRSTQDGPQASLIKDGIMKTRALKLALLASTLAGLTGTTVAAPTLFTATATVQNAVTITQTTPLNFGTVFASKTGVFNATPAATDSARILLTPAGLATKTDSSVVATPKLLTLGGATAGVFSAPGLPSNAKVGIKLTGADGAALVEGSPAGSCAYDTPPATGRIVLKNGADPTVAFFCVDSFTSDLTNLMPATSAAAATGGDIGFGITTLTFKLGATLIAQTPLSAAVTAPRTFQAGAYTGDFGMEVTFP